MYYIKTFETTKEYKKSSLNYPNISLVEEDSMLYFQASDYVDLGLTSGTLWMKCNIGATSETDYGLYFQWGDTVGYTGDAAKTHSTWSTCPGNGGKSSYKEAFLATWDKEHLTNNTLNTDVDAAYIHSNGRMKMPTTAQCQELQKETNHSYVTNYNNTGINGMKFVSKKNASKYIFIPNSGYFSDGKFNTSNNGGVWTSRMSIEDSGWRLVSDTLVDDSYIFYSNRCCAQCVRGVVI